MVRLRIGVVGLGEAWKRSYRPALERLRDRFVVDVVTDPGLARSAATARREGCRYAASVGDLLDHKPDAVLLCGRSWYGTWPAESACRRGLPVFCGTSLASDGHHAERLIGVAREQGSVVVVDLRPRFSPATRRLRECLPEIGAIDQVIAQVAVRRSPGDAAALAMLDWCSVVIGPTTVSRSSELKTRQALHWSLDFDGGASAHVLIWRSSGPCRAKLEVVGAEGVLTASLPGRVTLQKGRVRQTFRLPHRPGAVSALRQFHAAVTRGTPPAADLQDAYRAFQWMHAAAGRSSSMDAVS